VVSGHAVSLSALPSSFLHHFHHLFQGSALTLLVPVKGWSGTYIKNKINVIITASAAVIMYGALMFFMPKKRAYETVIAPPTSRTNQITGGTALFHRSLALSLSQRQRVVTSH
jgi:hypothetical protein